MLVYLHWTAPQSIDPTDFLPIDPMPRAFPRRDDMGRKAGMTCFAEPAGCLDCFVVPPRNAAKRQRVRSQERVRRKVFRVWERQTLTGLGGEARPTWGRGARFVRWAHDVGLDSFALSYQEERTRKDEIEEGLNRHRSHATAQSNVGMTYLLRPAPTIREDMLRGA